MDQRGAGHEEWESVLCVLCVFPYRGGLEETNKSRWPQKVIGDVFAWVVWYAWLAGRRELQRHGWMKPLACRETRFTARHLRGLVCLSSSWRCSQNALE